MHVSFRTKRLETCFRSERDAVRTYGPQVARRYVQRVQILQTVRDVEEARRLPAIRCHPLKGDRAGEWAVNLTGFQRLIFTVTDDAGTHVRIEEVSKHYGD